MELDLYEATKLNDIAIAKINKYMADYKSNRKGFTIKVNPIKSIRNNKQNRWYWGVLIRAIARTGHYSEGYKRSSIGTIHEDLKRMFLPPIIRKVKVPMYFCPNCNLYFDKKPVVCPVCSSDVYLKFIDTDFEDVASTTNLNVSEFSVYLKKCKDYLINIGGYLTTNEYEEYMNI